MMKKVLSVLLCAALLLSGGVCAWAAEEPAGDHSHTVSDVYLILDNQIVDLAGITIELDVAENERMKAGRLHVNQDGESAGELGLTLTPDGLFVLHADSPTLGHKDYGVDPAVILAKTLQGGIDSLVSLLQSVDSNSVARGIVDKIMASISGTGEPAAEEPAAEEPAAEEQTAPGIYVGVGDQVINLASISIEGDALGVITGCIGEPETSHMGGVSYYPNGGTFEMPDGEYQVQTFNFDTETVCQLLDMVYVDGEPAGLGDKVRESGVEFLFAGTFYDNDEAHVFELSASLSSDEFSYVFGGGYDQLVTDEGTKTSYNFGTSTGVDPETASVMGFGFTVSDGTHEGEQFTAASVNVDDLVMLTDMEPEQALEELDQSLGMLLSDMIAPALAQIMALAPETTGESAE